MLGRVSNRRQRRPFEGLIGSEDSVRPESLKTTSDSIVQMNGERWRVESIARIFKVHDPRPA